MLDRHPVSTRFGTLPAAAQDRLNELKTQRDALKSKPQKTKEDNEALRKLDRAVKKAQKDKDFTGENHSQRGKR